MSEIGAPLLAEAAAPAEPKAARLGFVAGLVPEDKLNPFERLLFRATRGNMFLKSASVGAVVDPTTGERVEKAVFMVFFAGERARSKILKARIARPARPTAPAVFSVALGRAGKDVSSRWLLLMALGHVGTVDAPLTHRRKAAGVDNVLCLPALLVCRLVLKWLRPRADLRGFRRQPVPLPGGAHAPAADECRGHGAPARAADHHRGWCGLLHV